MFDIVVTQRVNPGMEQAFEAIAREAEAKTVANDEGCLRYEWYRTEEPQTYLLIERWESVEAVQKHIKAPHMEALTPKLRECVPEPFKINRLARLE